MPYEPHYRLTCSGTIGEFNTVVEQFSFGVSLARNGGDGGVGNLADIDNDQFADIAADTRAFFSRGATNIRPGTVLREVKLAWIGADGKYLRDPMIDTTNAFGGGDAALYPPQVSLCVSLGTEKRGPRGRGRFYLPSPGMAIVAADRQITSASADLVLGSVATWLDALNNEPNADVLGLGVCVASTFGENHPVTKVRIGRTLDTVRSRRTSVDELYRPFTQLASNV